MLKMYRNAKTKRYLSKKDKNLFSPLDGILKMYVNGSIAKILSEYEILSIVSSVNAKHKFFKIEYQYQNIITVIEFYETKYTVCIYHLGLDVDEIDKSFVDRYYDETFDFSALVKELHCSIKQHPELKDISKRKSLIKKYKMVSSALMAIPLLFILVVSLYVIITGNKLQLELWYLSFFVIPILAKVFFDIKFSKMNE